MHAKSGVASSAANSLSLLQTQRQEMSSPATAFSLPDPPRDTVGSLDVSTTNDIVAGSWTSEVHFWRAGAAAPLVQKHGGPVLAVKFGADASTVFSGSADRTVQMWLVNGEIKSVPKVVAEASLLLAAAGP